MKQKLTSPHLCSQINWSSEISEVFLQETIHKLAKEKGFFKRIRKLLPDKFVQICCFWDWKESYPSLGRQCQCLAEKFRIKMKEQSLNERFGKSAVAFIKEILGQVSAIRSQEKIGEACTEFFSAIYVFDSTVQQLFSKCEELFKGCGGGASIAGIKIQYGYDLLSGNLWHLVSRNASDPDHTYRATNINPGALLLFDLGYFLTSFLNSIYEKKAFFLCRLRFGTVLFVEVNGQMCRLDIMKFIGKMKPGDVKELKVFIGAKERVPARFVVEKMSPELAASKRRKLKYDPHNKRKNISEERLEFCDVSAFVTNIPQEKLSTENVRIIYSLRWQIEIVFKTWKSVFRLKDITNMNPYRLACMFYGALIRIFIATKVFWVYKILAWNEHQIELSEIKGMRILAEKTITLFKMLTMDFTQAKCFWDQLGESLLSFAVKQSRKKKPLPLQNLKLFSLT